MATIRCAARQLFESVVQRCMAEGLVGAEGFAVDASLIAADANKQRSVPSKDWKPEELKENAVRAAREYLATLDHAAFGAASPVTPKFISRSDPAAQWTGAHKGHAFFAYSTNYLIDTDHGVIVDVEATRAIRQAEVGAAQTMIERTETCFGMGLNLLPPTALAGSAESLDWLVNQKESTVHPWVDKSNRTNGTFARDDFVFDPERDDHHVPGGQSADPGSSPPRLLDPRGRLARTAWITAATKTGLRRLRTQVALLPGTGTPQGAKAHSRGRPGRGSRSRLNA